MASIVQDQPEATNDALLGPIAWVVLGLATLFVAYVLFDNLWVRIRERRIKKFIERHRRRMEEDRE